MSEFNKPFFLMTEDKILKFGPPKVITNAKEVLAGVAANEPKVVKSVYTVNENPVKLVSLRPDRICLGVGLPSLSLNTFYSIWTPQEPPEGFKDLLVPTFLRNHNTVQLSLAWTPPPNMELWLAVEMQHIPQRWELFRTTMFCCVSTQQKSEKSKGYFQLPLSNTYENGEICLGKVIISGNTPLDVLQKVLETMNSTVWGQDLLPEDNHEIFRFDPATFKQVPPTEEWWLHCQNVNTTIMEVIRP